MYELSFHVTQFGLKGISFSQMATLTTVPLVLTVSQALLMLGDELVEGSVSWRNPLAQCLPRRNPGAVQDDICTLSTAQFKYSFLKVFFDRVHDPVRAHLGRKVLS